MIKKIPIIRHGLTRAICYYMYRLFKPSKNQLDLHQFRTGSKAPNLPKDGNSRAKNRLFLKKNFLWKSPVFSRLCWLLTKLFWKNRKKVVDICFLRRYSMHRKTKQTNDGNASDPHRRLMGRHIEKRIGHEGRLLNKGRKSYRSSVKADGHRFTP